MRALVALPRVFGRGERERLAGGLDRLSAPPRADQHARHEEVLFEVGRATLQARAEQGERLVDASHLGQRHRLQAEQPNLLGEALPRGAHALERLGTLAVRAQELDLLEVGGRVGVGEQRAHAFEGGERLLRPALPAGAAPAISRSTETAKRRSRSLASGVSLMLRDLSRSS